MIERRLLRAPARLPARIVCRNASLAVIEMTRYARAVKRRAVFAVANRPSRRSTQADFAIFGNDVASDDARHSAATEPCDVASRKA